MPYSTTQLTPEQIAAITNAWTNRTNLGSTGTASYNGNDYGLLGLQSGGGEGGDRSTFNPQLIAGYQPGDASKPLADRSQFDMGGNYYGMGQNMDGGKTNLSDFKDFGQMVMTLAPMAIGGAMLSGMGGLGSAAAGVGDAAGMTGSGAFLGGEAGAGGLGAGGLTVAGNGAAMGPITAAQAAAGDAAFAQQFAPYLSGAGGAVGGAAGASSGGGGGVPMDGGGGFAGGGDAPDFFGSSSQMGPLTSAQSMAGDAQLAGQLAPYYAGTSAAAGGGLSSYLQSLGISPSMLGTGASILGGLAGSQGVKKTETTSKEPWAALTPYLTGSGGLLDSANTLMRSQLASGMPGFTQEMNAGQGLLSQPIAGNGVAQFQAMPRFGR